MRDSPWPPEERAGGLTLRRAVLEANRRSAIQALAPAPSSRWRRSSSVALWSTLPRRRSARAWRRRYSHS